MKDAAFTPSVPIPSMQKSAYGMAMSMGVFSNARYQLVGGIDRYLFDHAEHLIPYLAASTAFRWVSTKFGNETRLHFQVQFHRHADNLCVTLTPAHGCRQLTLWAALSSEVAWR